MLSSILIEQAVRKAATI